MNIDVLRRERPHPARRTGRPQVGRYLAGCLLTLLAGQAATAIEIDGFTEPSRTISVASSETGTIKSIAVREGETIEQGQILAQLDDELYMVLLAIADEAMRAQSQLKSAQAELDMRRQRLEKLAELRAAGHARQEELDRAQTDVTLAETRVLAAEELLALKRLEHEKTKIQLARRSIRSPINGVVTTVFKDHGEFVAPNDPHILEIVELDPLLATFSVPSYEAVRLSKDQSVSVYLEDAGRLVTGTVELISPVTDAESGTVRVKVRVANAERKYRSGERCTLQLNRPVPTSRRPAGQ
jgi:RND family efflux transporter MFP subunit